MPIALTTDLEGMKDIKFFVASVKGLDTSVI